MMTTRNMIVFPARLRVSVVTSILQLPPRACKDIRVYAGRLIE